MSISLFQLKLLNRMKELVAQNTKVSAENSHLPCKMMPLDLTLKTILRVDQKPKVLTHT